MSNFQGTVCPRSSDPFYTVSYYIIGVTLGHTVYAPYKNGPELA